MEQLQAMHKFWGRFGSLFPNMSTSLTWLCQFHLLWAATQDLPFGFGA